MTATMKKPSVLGTYSTSKKSKIDTKTKKRIGISAYILFVLLPIYWLLNMSFKSNEEILGGLTFWPSNFTFDNYAVIFTDPTWYMGYVNSMIYVSMNMVITLLVALPVFLILQLSYLVTPGFETTVASILESTGFYIFVGHWLTWL